MCKFAKNFKFCCKIQLFNKNVWKKMSKKWWNIKLWKALGHAISNMQNFCKILKNLIFNQEKLKMCKFPLTGFLQKICNFFSQNLCNAFLYVKGFPKKLNFIKIWQVKVGQKKDLVCYRQKQSFRQYAWRLRQLVLKPGFRKAFGYVRKVRKFQQPQTNTF